MAAASLDPDRNLNLYILTLMCLSCDLLRGRVTLKGTCPPPLS